MRLRFSNIIILTVKGLVLKVSNCAMGVYRTCCQNPRAVAFILGKLCCIV